MRLRFHTPSLNLATTMSVVGVIGLLAFPSVTLAHAVVYPRTSSPGAYEKYVLRVPNERDRPTLRVEIRFPAELRVVSFGDVPGWTLNVLTDSAQRIIGAVWTGILPKERFVEFPFVGVNPKSATKLSWPTFQTYAGGERVEWTGSESSKTPASATAIDETPTSGTTALTPFYLALGAAVLSLISLGLSLRSRKEARTGF